MKYIVLTMMAVILFPLSARAELTENDIQSFNNDYVETYASCDVNKIVPFMDMHYADDYKMQLKLPNGEVRGGTGADNENLHAVLRSLIY